MYPKKRRKKKVPETTPGGSWRDPERNSVSGGGLGCQIDVFRSPLVAKRLPGRGFGVPGAQCRPKPRGSGCQRTFPSFRGSGCQRTFPPFRGPVVSGPFRPPGGAQGPRGAPRGPSGPPRQPLVTPKQVISRNFERVRNFWTSVGSGNLIFLRIFGRFQKF